MMLLFVLKEIYFEVLPVILLPTVILASVISITSEIDFSYKAKSSYNKFINIIGFCTFGFICGLTYPISFPLMSLYVIDKFMKEI